MLVAVGVFALGGVGVYLATPQPATRSMAELRDAGIGDGQSIILVCPERITPQTKRRLNAVQPGFLTKGQQYARVARIAKCFNPDGGNCWRPADLAPRMADLEGTLIVPSLRQNLTGVDLDAGLTDDGGADSSDVDDSLQYRNDDCRVTQCSTYDAGGLFANGVCGNLNRLWAEVPPCMLPNCYTLPDGGWDDTAVVDCQKTDAVFGGGQTTHWAGCNVIPASQASGTACLPVECSVVAGDNPIDVLGGR
jgi:hypothetical protein